MTTNFFSTLSFVATFGSGSGMCKNQDPGSGKTSRIGNTGSEAKFLVIFCTCILPEAAPLYAYT
jgi:hypothetical protein